MLRGTHYSDGMISPKCSPPKWLIQTLQTASAALLLSHNVNARLGGSLGDGARARVDGRVGHLKKNFSISTISENENSNHCCIFF